MSRVRCQEFHALYSAVRARLCSSNLWMRAYCSRDKGNNQARMIVPESITAPNGETSKRIMRNAESLWVNWVIPSGGEIYPDQPNACKERKITNAPVSLRIKVRIPKKIPS